MGAPWMVRITPDNTLSIVGHTHGCVVIAREHWPNGCEPSIDEDGYFVFDDECEVPNLILRRAEYIAKMSEVIGEEDLFLQGR